MELEIKAAKKYDVLLSADDEWFKEIDRALSYLFAKFTSKEDVNKGDLLKNTTVLWDLKSKLVLAHNNANN